MEKRDKGMPYEVIIQERNKVDGDYIQLYTTTKK